LKIVSQDLPEILEKLVPRELKMLNIGKGDVLNRFAVTAIFFYAKGKELKLISFKNIQSVLEEYESDAWRKLTGVLTHEIMNSITPIISLSETLSETPSPADENRYAVMNRAMQIIHRRSKGLIDFLNNYRQLTRIPEPVPVTFSAKEMLTDIACLLKAEGIVFSFRITHDDISIVADRGLTEQVLINLLKNAHDACRDAVFPNIELKVYKNEYQRPVITVADNGYGIVPEALNDIFVPFFTTKPGGSGIGLSICRQIMNLHHGSISVKSEVDKGTTVTLRF
jgi:signal transduction histidine kinase